MRSPLSHEENFSTVQRPREDLVANGSSQSRDRLPIRPVVLCGETNRDGVPSHLLVQGLHRQYVTVDGGSTTSTQAEYLWEPTTQSRVWSCLLAVDGHEQ